MSLLILLTAVAFSGIIFHLYSAGEASQKIIIAALSLAAVILQLPRMIERDALILIIPLVIYTAYAFVSAFVYSSSLLYALTSISYLIIGLILYIWLIQTRFSLQDLRKLIKLFYAIVLLQIIFVFVKLVFHGIDEKILIGTMSHTAGQLGFLFPAVAVPILIFLLRNRNRFLIYGLVTLMFIFGIINEKRAVVFLLPLIIIGSMLVNHSNYKVLAGRILIGGLLSVPAVILGISLIPSLNPDSAYGGGISLTHAYRYAFEYLTMDYGGTLQGSYESAAGDTGIQVGRITLWISIVKWLVSQNTVTFLFGHGFGSVTPSMWLHHDNDLLFSLTGTRGAISSAGLSTIETGIVGLALISIFFVSALIKMIVAYRNSNMNIVKRWFGTLIVINVIFCFDFFLYSTVLLRTMPMPLIFFSMLASIYIAKRFEREATALNNHGNV